MSLRKLSVIIPSYNSYGTLTRTVESVLSQPKSYLEEIIIVDSSDDGRTAELLASFQSPLVRVIRLDQKTMPAIGRNLGAAQAKGDILAFIDSDAYAAEDWAEKIERAVDQGCLVGGGPILLPPGQRTHRIALAQYFLQFNEFMGASKRKVVDFSPSCNLFCEKELFKRIGGFPEIRASEDVLFGFRANRDAPYFFDPAIRVFHIFSMDPKRLHSNQKLLGAYVLYYRRERYRRWYYGGPWPAILLPVFLMVKFMRISGRILRSGPSWARAAFLWTLPTFLSGLLSWGAGFLEACRKKERLDLS